MEKEREQLLENMMRTIGELHRHFATSRDTFLAQYELTRPQMELLVTIKRQKYTTSELAKLFSISPSAVSQMVDQLETKQLVKRVRGTKDRRLTYVTLAPQTHKYFEAVRNRFTKHLDNRFRCITNAELKTLQQILTKTINTIEE